MLLPEKIALSSDVYSHTTAWATASSPAAVPTDWLKDTSAVREGAHVTVRFVHAVTASPCPPRSHSESPVVPDDTHLFLDVNLLGAGVHPMHAIL